MRPNLPIVILDRRLMSVCVVPCMRLCCILHHARVLCSFKDDTTIVILDPDMMLGMSPPFDEVRTAIAATEPRESHRCHGTYTLSRMRRAHCSNQVTVAR